MQRFPREFTAYLKTLPFLGQMTCAQSSVIAGSYQEILMIYEVGSAALADGAWLKIVFKFYSDWGLFQTSDPKAANYLTASFVRRASFPSESEPTVRSLKVRFDQKGHERPYQKAIIVDIVDGYLRPGDKIELRLGDRRYGGPGTRVQTFVEETFHFRCFVDTIGASRFARVPGDVQLAIRAGAPAREILITPRLVRPRIQFPVTMRLEDLWGNLAASNDASAPFLEIWRQGEKLNSLPMSWGDARGGWARVEIVLSEEGDYELRAGGGARALVTAASSLSIPRALFADLHIHSEDTVGVNTTEHTLAFARDAAGLDIAGYTANDFNVRADRWADAVRICRQLNEPGKFLCYPGTEWCGSSAVGGDRNVIFLGDEVRFPLGPDGKSLRVFDWNEDTEKGRAQDGQLWPASALHDAYRDMGENILLIPHVGGRRAIFDWHDSELERLVEIASSWGHFDWFYREALARGLKVGASAAGDEHRGRPGGGAPGVGSFGVRGGITGVLAKTLTPADVGAALRARHTWAATGSRRVALLSSGAHQQGDEFVGAGSSVPLVYRLFGDVGWERLEIRDEQGEIMLARDFDAELGYAPNRLRVRWGGARIKDRYRWAEWHGRVVLSGSPVISWRAEGLEHSEEKIAQIGAGEFQIRTDTYGDSDYVEFVVENLAALRIELNFEIDAYNKTGPALERNRDPLTPGAMRQLSGAELLASPNGFRWELGGAELFLAVERLSAEPLPTRVEGNVVVPLTKGAFSHRAFYLFARERDDHKVWTSPLFVTA